MSIEHRKHKRYYVKKALLFNKEEDFDTKKYLAELISISKEGLSFKIYLGKIIDFLEITNKIKLIIFLGLNSDSSKEFYAEIKHITNDICECQLLKQGEYNGHKKR